VGAEGKRSLDKMDKVGLRQDAGFPLYCFPQLSRSDPSIDSGSGITQKGFQPYVSKEASSSSGAPWPMQENGSAGLEDEEAAQRRAKEIEKSAYSKGFQEGKEAGRNSSRQELDPILSNFREALQELVRVKREIYMRAEKEAVELAMAVARKIVCQELSVRRDIILGVVREALKTVEDHEKITIKVNPRDLEVIKDTTVRNPDFFDNLGHVQFEEDPGLGDGGCVIETALGEIDARIERQLEAVEEAFRAEMMTHSSAG